MRDRSKYMCLRSCKCECDCVRHICTYVHVNDWRENRKIKLEITEWMYWYTSSSDSKSSGGEWHRFVGPLSLLHFTDLSSCRHHCSFFLILLYFSVFFVDLQFLVFLSSFFFLFFFFSCKKCNFMQFTRRLYNALFKLILSVTVPHK